MIELDFWNDNIGWLKTSQELNELKIPSNTFHKMDELQDEVEIYWTSFGRGQICKGWIVENSMS